jgi:aspartate/methionine/tyrosine aminotransferase
MPRLNPLYAQMPTTIFEAMSGLARQHGAINLGQGFPDGPPPPALAQAATRAMAERSQQYPPMAGVPELRDAVAAFYARRQGLNLSREHVIVTSGATEAVAAAILATVQPGDEVLVLARPMMPMPRWCVAPAACRCSSRSPRQTGPCRLPPCARRSPRAPAP